MQTLETTDDVIDALGGNAAVARLTDRDPGVVWNWRSAYRGSFPASTFLVLQGALRSINRTAPPSLWGMEEAKPRPSEQGGVAA
jgi:hypothetical protein